MKQLINKANPKIRIIAERFEEQLGGYMLTTDTNYYCFQDWTLSDYEEPKGDKVEPIIEDDRTVGVKIPIINKTIYFTDIKDNVSWEDAVKYAESLSKKIPTYKELCILAYFRKEIEKIYPKFKELTYIWGEQYSAYLAWSLGYYGNLNNNNKYYDFTVVPLADLPEQPQLTEFEKELVEFAEGYSRVQNLDTKDWFVKESAKHIKDCAKKELEK